MHNLVPEFILDNQRNGIESGEFQAIALFVDIAGFTALTDTLMQHGQHGAEAMAGILQTIFEPLILAVYEQGGFVANLSGDGFTGLFPLLTSMPNPYLRALAAATRVQAQVDALGTHKTPYGESVVSAKVGLADGNTQWAILRARDASRGIFYFRGSAVDGSAEAEHLAQAGQIIVSASVLDQIQTLTESRPVAAYHEITRIHGDLPSPVDVVVPPVDIEAQSRFYPQRLITQRQPGEFRQVVTLFIGLPTLRTDAQLATFVHTLFDLLNQYCGLFSGLRFGDKGAHLLLFWGMPTAHENDVSRALGFILDLQTRTGIPIDAGMTYQIGFAGYCGSSLRDDYTLQGRGINLAARFMAAAGRGEIWVDEEIARKAHDEFEIEELGERRFKGFAQQQGVYQLWERKERSETFFEDELIGRDHELALLDAFVSPLWHGQFAGLMVVLGEPGIGKSRLVHTFLEDLQPPESHRGTGFAHFLGQTDEILREALNPWRYWLLDYFGQSEQQSEVRNKRNFNRKLDSLVAATETGDENLAGEVDRTRSFLGALVGLHWPDTLYVEVDAQARYDNTFIGLTSLLCAESLQQPVLFFLEDIQWLDQDSVSFLQYLARTLTADETRQYPIAVIATARREQNALKVSADQAIDLDGLSRHDLAALAASELGGPPAPALLDMLAERAEGNPFFAEQILRYLRDEGLLIRGEDGWMSAETEQIAPLPRDVRSLLVARLDSLAQTVRGVVQTASVLGREFETAILATIFQADKDGSLADSQFDQLMTQAERSAIWSAVAELRYLFRHALLRDAAYRMQAHARRQHLHRLAVEVLEKSYPLPESGVTDEQNTPYAVFAHHAEQAGLFDKAHGYLAEAGRVAEGAYQNSSAVDYYTRALALTNEGTVELRFDLLLARERVNDLRGERDAQAHDLAELEMLAVGLDQVDKQTSVILRRGQLAANTANYPAAISAADEAIPLAIYAGDELLEAEAQRLWGDVLREQGNYDAARPHYERSRELAQRCGDLRVSAQSLHGLGALADYQGRYVEARASFSKALDIYRQLNDRRGENRSLSSLGVVAAAQGKDEAARTFLENSLEICRQIGDRQGESRALNTLAILDQRAGKLVDSEARFAQSLFLCRQIGYRYHEAFGLNNLGWVIAQTGDYSRAQHHLETATVIQNEIGDKWVQVLCLNNLGVVAHETGDLSLARDHLQAGLDVAREIGDRRDAGMIMNELAAVEFDAGQPDAARSILAEALSLRRELGYAPHVAEDLALLANVHLKLGNLSQSEACLIEALEMLDSDPAITGAERPFRIHLNCFYVMRALGQPQAKTVLLRAHTILQARAALLPDGAIRDSFLSKVPSHRMIVDEYGASLLDKSD